jgi:hypothetical protein
MPARDGPARLTPAVVEWQAKQPGGVWRNRSSPRASGASILGDRAEPALAVTAVPGKVAPATRMGRGGQPWLSTAAIHCRKAMTASISLSLSFGLGEQPARLRI